MNRPAESPNELSAAAAFDNQSATFDQQYGSDAIIRYKRKRVREQLLLRLKPGGSILELNAGTGEDAIYLAELGFTVHATDVSTGMQQQLAAKVAAAGLEHRVSHELCSFTQLERLQHRGPFDCIFSNFAGLNCTGELDRVLAEMRPLLHPGGIVVLVILPPFCLWESLLLFRGYFRTATRRLFSKGGRSATIDGLPFRCWYYSPRFVSRQLGPHFKLLGLEGLCSLVPPSYIEHFGECHPGWFARLCSWEDRLKTSWPWKFIGDYYIISFVRVG